MLVTTWKLFVPQQSEEATGVRQLETKVHRIARHGRRYALYSCLSLHKSGTQLDTQLP